LLLVLLLVLAPDAVLFGALHRVCLETLRPMKHLISEISKIRL
jgi:hypothetical protein